MTLAVLLMYSLASVAGLVIVGDEEKNPVLENTPAVEQEAEEENKEQNDEENQDEENQEDENSQEDEETEKVDVTESWELLLANVDNPLPQGFEVKTAVVQNSFKMDERIADTVKKMIDDAKADGVDLMICSAYRSVDRQQQLFDEQVAQYVAQGKSKADAEALTATMIAIPGTSEHHTGLAADIVTPTHQTLDPQFADTAAGKWLQENAVNYGFILRYPEGKEDITKIIYESWHYRYVGVEHAKIIKEKGLCLEEYIEELKGE